MTARDNKRQLLKCPVLLDW